MADETPPTAAELLDAIDTTRALYGKLRTDLEVSLGKFFDDPADVADDLLYHSEEFGREHALELYGERLHSAPIRPDLGDMTFAELAEKISGQVDAMLDAHDRLDDLTHKRQKLLARELPPGVRIINVQGREFELDSLARELRAVDRPGERYPLPAEAEQDMTLTQHMARETGAALAEPPPPKPERSRGR